MAFRKSRRLRRNLIKSRRNRKYGGGPEYGNLRLEQIVSRPDYELLTTPNYIERTENYREFLKRNSIHKNEEFDNIYLRELDAIQRRN